MANRIVLRKGLHEKFGIGVGKENENENAIEEGVQVTEGMTELSRTLESVDSLRRLTDRRVGFGNKKPKVKQLHYR